MNFGLENGKFFIEYSGCTRKPGSLREESLIRAREIYNKNNKVMLCLSSGLDSQIAMYSFLSQGIPVEFSFLRLDGFNDNEYQNLKVLENKWGFKANVVNINPNKIRDELDHLVETLDVHHNHCLQRKFVEQIPEDHDIVQVIHDPWTLTHRQLSKHYIFHGYYDPEIGRYRALKSIPRTGDIQMFGDSHEFFLSCIGDELFEYFFKSWTYYDSNNLKLRDKPVPNVTRYEYYIKPMLYGKHWGDELTYFPKFAGYENIEWMMSSVPKLRREKIVAIEMQELIKHMSTIGAPATRFYELQKEYLNFRV